MSLRFASSMLAAVLLIGALGTSCATRNVGMEPQFLAALIISPSNMADSVPANWTLSIFGGVKPYSVHWDFGGGATPNTVDASGVSHAARDIEQTDSSTTVEMRAGLWIVEATVVDAHGSEFVTSQSYAVGPGFDNNLAPQAVLVADFVTGIAPFAVNFDASFSSDPDGSITNYEWDFDGDGVYSEAGIELAALGQIRPATVTYDTAGSFLARVWVTDNGSPGLLSSASLTINVSGAAVNQPPTVSLAADPTAGREPLTVTMNATASDPDGSIARYEWDFDDNGTFDQDSGTNATVQHVYPVAGAYTARVRVSDSGSPALTATATVGITVAANQAPAAALSANPLSGIVPLMVMFDASASADPDGSITRYEWDYDNDGTFDEDTGTTATALHSYAAPGTFTAVVRVTDNGTPGLSSTATVDITGNANQPPTVSLGAPVTTGKFPLTVSFAATANDADGSITQVEWDFEDDGTFDQDTGTVAAVQHTYTAAGSFTCRVRVTDNGNPGLTATATLGITANPNQGPSAAVSANPDNGNVPLTVSFDAGASTDPDGSITLYEWDWESDGTFDVNSGASPNAQHTFDSQNEGPWTVTVRVTDDGQPLLATTATVDVMVGPANQAPTAIFFADNEGGSAPLTLNFDASQSFDNDGFITRYQWDWEDDGIFDEDNGTNPLATHTFVDPGQYTVRLRVTDDGNPDLTGEETFFVFVFGQG